VKTSILVDTNVFIDVFGSGGGGGSQSASRAALIRLGENAVFVINPIVFSELAPMFRDLPQLEGGLSRLGVLREFVPWKAAFEAGVAHLAYRKSGGLRERTLPDFLIAAHASVNGYSLLTKDRRRYETYFPNVEVISP